MQLSMGEAHLHDRQWQPHEAFVEGSAVPQALHNHVEEAVVLSRQVLEAWASCEACC